MIQATDIKKGTLLDVDGQPCVVVDVSLQSPSARGASMIVKIRMKSLKTGQVMDRSLRGTEKLPEPDFELHEVQLSYLDSQGWHFLDQVTYEDILFNAEELGEDRGYLTEGLEGLKVRFYNGKPIGLDLPLVVELLVTETDPALKGATAAAQTKPATLETGLVIQVPPYLTTGERVRVDTRTGRFLERVR